MLDFFIALFGGLYYTVKCKTDDSLKRHMNYSLEAGVKVSRGSNYEEIINKIFYAGNSQEMISDMTHICDSISDDLEYVLGERWRDILMTTPPDRRRKSERKLNSWYQAPGLWDLAIEIYLSRDGFVARPFGRYVTCPYTVEENLKYEYKNMWCAVSRHCEHNGEINVLKDHEWTAWESIGERGDVEVRECVKCGMACSRIKRTLNPDDEIYLADAEKIIFRAYKTIEKNIMSIHGYSREYQLIDTLGAVTKESPWHLLEWRYNAIGGGRRLW